LKLLITGSTGFLGGRLTQFLVKFPDYKILLGSREPDLVVSVFPNAKLVKMDWQNVSELTAVCDGVEVIVHLAGMNAGECADASLGQLEADVLATKNLLKAAIKNKVKRFIYLSTAHVYSSKLSGDISEVTPTMNKHPYALNHIVKERLVLQAYQNGDIEAVVIRLSNAFGVPESAKANCWMLLVNDLCRQVATTNKLVLKSTGQQRRDFVTITDFCLAIEHLINLSSNKLGDGIFNLGGQWAPTVLEITDYVAKRYHFLSGEIPTIQHEPHMNNISSPSFCFSIQKLLDTHYNPGPKFKVEQEIDSLVSLCIKIKNL
jgi:UDP-glucose 4-epimerase